MSSEKPDLGFTTFLGHIGLTHKAFMAHSVLERGQLFTMYLQTIQPSYVPTSSSPNSPAISPIDRPTNSSILPPPLTSLTNEEIYELLENSSEYKKISLNGYHFKRNKAIYPTREINLPDSDLEKLSATQITWLSRVYAHVPDKNIWNDHETPMTTFYLMKTVFSLENLKRFDGLLHKLDVEGTGLAGQTIYRGYTSLISCIQTLTGKKGSFVAAKISNLSFEAIDRLTDFRNKWARANTLSINHSESKRITRVSEETVTCESMLKQMYFLLCVERYWLLGEYSEVPSNNIPALNLKYATGFCFFATILGRPTSRPEINTTMFKTAMISNHKLVPESPFSLNFEDHKTADSYGTLHCVFPGWLATILHLYMTKIRPALIRNEIWGRGSLQNVWPQNVVSMMDKFLESTCSGQLNPTVIRNTICQAFDEIKEDSKFFPFRDRLQYSAAHRTDKSKVIVQNYTLKFKIEQEQLLQSYIHETFYQPALLTIKFILSQPVARIKKRKRAVVSEEKNESSESDEEEENREEVAVELTDFKENQYYYDTEEIKAIEPPVPKRHPSLPAKGITPRAKDDAIENDLEGDAESLLHDLTADFIPESMDFMSQNKPTTQPKTSTEYAMNDEQSEAGSLNGGEKEFPREVDNVMRVLLQAAYRESYLIRSDTINRVIKESLIAVYPLIYTDIQSKEFETDESRTLIKLALTRARVLVKNWTNTSPVKQFTKQFIDGKLPRTVKALKELCAKSKVEAAFQKHFCFRAKKGCKFDLSNSQLRRFRKDCEQRVVAFYGQLALGETPGKKPDSQGHIGGLKTWRLSDFSFDRFEEIEVVEGDDEKILDRDYSLKGDTAKKKTSTKKAHKQQ